MAEPDDMPPYRYIEAAEQAVESMRLNHLGPPSRENQCLEAIAYAVIAIAKMMGRHRL